MYDIIVNQSYDVFQNHIQISHKMSRRDGPPRDICRPLQQKHDLGNDSYFSDFVNRSKNRFLSPEAEATQRCHSDPRELKFVSIQLKYLFQTVKSKNGQSLISMRQHFSLKAGDFVRIFPPHCATDGFLYVAGVKLRCSFKRL